MDAMAVHSSITRYIDHLGDVAWIEMLVGEHGLDRVLEECAAVLTGGDRGEVGHVTTFLRDIGIYGIIGDERVGQVRQRMPSVILPALRPLLQAPVLEVRMEAIYTLGKLTFVEEAGALRQAFPSYLERDPFCLERVLGELQWLAGGSPELPPLIEQTIAHPSYLSRWAALGHLSCTTARQERWLRTLSMDASPLVAAEARHLIDSQSPDPPLTFDVLEIRYLNHMAERGQADYQIEDLDAFVRRAST
jgi:hypothetical protein